MPIVIGSVVAGGQTGSIPFGSLYGSELMTVPLRLQAIWARHADPFFFSMGLINVALPVLRITVVDGQPARGHVLRLTYCAT